VPRPFFVLRSCVGAYQQQQQQQQPRQLRVGLRLCWFGRARVGGRAPPQVRPCRLMSRHPWRSWSRQPTRARPSTMGWCAREKRRWASAVEMIGLIGLVGGSGTVRPVRAIGAFDVVGTVKSVEAAELLELALTADTAFDSPLRCVALRCTAMATDHLSKGGDVWVGGTVVPHGCGSRAPMDGFTARPANPHTHPTSPRTVGTDAFERAG